MSKASMTPEENIRTLRVPRSEKRAEISRYLSLTRTSLPKEERRRDRDYFNSVMCQPRGGRAKKKGSLKNPYLFLCVIIAVLALSSRNYFLPFLKSKKRLYF